MGGDSKMADETKTDEGDTEKPSQKPVKPFAL